MRQRTAGLSISSLLVLLLLCAPGCQSTVQNFVKNRARDLGESFRVQVGAGLGLGASVSAGGVLDAGLSIASVPRSAGIGWVYGEGYAFGVGQGASEWESEIDLTLLAPVAIPILMIPSSPPPDGSSTLLPLHWRVEGSDKDAMSISHASHACFSLVPAFFAGVGNPDEPLPPRSYPQDPELDPPPFTVHPTAWSKEGEAKAPKARLHGFDIEARIYAGVVYAKVGFSPGEFVDFLLGCFGLDIAGDDRPETPATVVEP